MSDVVATLRDCGKALNPAFPTAGKVMRQAAAEIERLQARVAELEGDFHTMTVEAFARGHAAGVNSVTGYAEGFAAAREMAARVCDGFSAVNPLTGKERGGSHQGAMLAAAIRALRPDGDA
jgi:hypothetical protein